MRDLFSKAIAGSMIAGAALLVAACGTNEEAATDNTTFATDDAMMDAGTNDVTAIDAGTTGADANLGMGADMNMSNNMMMDTNMSNNMTMNNMNNGM